MCPVLRPLLAQPLSPSASHRRDSPLDRLLVRLDTEADQFTLALGDDDLRPYVWAGWTARPRSTYVSDLTQDLAYSSGVRRTLRQSGAFEISESQGHTAQAVRLMVSGYQRGGGELGLDEDAVVRLAEALGRAGLARPFAAVRDGDVQAAVVVASDGRRAFYWIAGSVPGPAMTVLADHVLRQLAEEGAETFDWCGANTPSIAEFKRRFGPRLAPAPLVRRATHPLLRVVDRFR